MQIIIQNKKDRIQMMQGRLVRLRNLCIDDVPIFAQWRQDSNLMKYYDEPYMLSFNEQSLILKARADSFDQIDYIVESLNGYEPIGQISLKKIDWVSRNCEIYSMIGESEKQQLAFGAEASWLALLIAYFHFNMFRVSARIFEYSHEARKLLEEVGFIQEANMINMMQQNGKSYDMKIYGLLKDDFVSFLMTKKGQMYLNMSKSSIFNIRLDYGTLQ